MVEVSEEQTRIDGYGMALPNTMLTLGYARLVLLVREDIQFKLLSRHMGPGSACIWIQLGAPGRKPLKVFFLYGTISPEPGISNLSNDNVLQLARWNTMLEGWKAKQQEM